MRSLEDKKRRAEYTRKWRQSEKGQATKQAYKGSEAEKRCRSRARKAMELTEAGRLTRGYFRLKSRAKDRGLSFELTKSEFFALHQLKCHYCGGDISTNGGLDRLDNSVGYTLENVVPCCTACNRIRGDNLTPDEMRSVASFLKYLRTEY